MPAGNALETGDGDLHVLGNPTSPRSLTHFPNGHQPFFSRPISQISFGRISHIPTLFDFEFLPDPGRVTPSQSTVFPTPIFLSAKL